MDSQQTSRPPVDLAAAQNAALVKAGGTNPQIQQAQLGGFPATSNGPLDGPARLQPRGPFPASRPPYALQRAPPPPPPPRQPFYGRPPQPGQGPRFPAAYGPQGFPPGRAPFPLGPPPRLPRPQAQQPPPGLQRPQSRLDARMDDLQDKLQQPQQPQQPTKPSVPDLEPQSRSTSRMSDEQGPAKDNGKAPLEDQRQPDLAAVQPSCAPSSDTSSVEGFDEGHRKSLATPRPHSPAAAAAAAAAADDDDDDDDDDDQAHNQPPAAQVDNTEPGLLLKQSPSIRSIRQDAENDSGVDESTQRREVPKSNGVSSRTPSKTRDADKRSAAGSPIKSPSKSIKSLPRTPDAAPSTADKKKVPMNKVQVGAAPSPNLKAVRSKIGSLENATHKPGGGKIKIENRKLDFSSAQPKIAAKNDKYTPSGGDKKIEQVKLQWNAKPKIGSLDNTTYKPGGGNKKIESVKLDFKDKAKPKVGSKENAKHVPGGGSVKSSTTSPKTPQDNVVNIESQKLDFKAESKVGSMDNMKHRPGGGDKKIFDDKSYLRQTSSNIGSVSGSGSQVAPRRPNSLVGLSPSDKKGSLDAPQPPPSTPTQSRNPSALSTPTALRTGSVKTPDTPTTGKKSLPGSPRKNKSLKELQLPKLASSNSDHSVTIETHKTKQGRIILPNL